MRSYTSLVCVAVTVLAVTVIAAQSALPLEGRWEGTLAAPPARGSRELGREAPPLRVFLLISPASDGAYSGKWLLNSGAKGPVDIGEVAIDGDAVLIEVPSSRGVWKGSLSADGLMLAGEWQQGGKTAPLVLRRTGPADDAARIDSRSPGTVMRR
jgi:uncharacterized protein